ncbi:RloB family protein [Paraflavitalea speifideaquila]|uniref:RloB family protein n=1 Tax=Paraflavitalea speifideaquila TaxID=3076558 RepID=UPI0028E60A04|nr:RloB family protein [Paraflavitalea speifideiaquila]
MARASKLQPQRDTVAIVGDGQTERIYFSDVRDTDRPANLSIFPDYPRKIGNYKGVLDRAKTLAENYDYVYALIDMDKIIQDKQQTAYMQDKAVAEAAGIIVLENNPCFEIWLLLHFVYTSRLFANCNEISEQLKAKGRIVNYDKSEKFLKNARLYKTYKNC